MKLDKLFLTGCDIKTEWQLPWFLNNYLKHNHSIPIWVADFGMSEEMIGHLESVNIKVFSFHGKLPASGDTKGWFKKPRAIYEATYWASTVCWLDTDCQVTGDLSSIFNYYVHGKLGMVKDRPWTTRRPENGTWYNSGVVVSDHNWNLRNWLLACESAPIDGDQEVLHNSLTEIQKLSVIEPLPHTYNTLRIDYIDNIAVENPLIIHHTGEKGNNTIRAMMK